MSDPDPTREVFSWRETAARLAALWKLHRFAFEPATRSFVARVAGVATVAGDAGAAGTRELRFTPPSCQSIDPDLDDPARYLEALERRSNDIGRMAIVLVHAGATALGVFDDESLAAAGERSWIAHKVIKKYVVRGNGKAQPLHRKTKGKSRYGSRLRLQNFEAQLQETNEKLREWWGTHGAFQRVFRHAPPRMIPDLDAAPPLPPWPPGFEVESIPFHVHVPDFAELKSVRWKLLHGEITTRETSD